MLRLRRAAASIATGALVAGALSLAVAPPASAVGSCVGFTLEPTSSAQDATGVAAWCTVPAGVTHLQYSITGASGRNINTGVGGRGAHIEGIIDVTGVFSLNVLAGGAVADRSGGGASGIWKWTPASPPQAPLVIAGGGGGPGVTAVWSGFSYSLTYVNGGDSDPSLTSTGAGDGGATGVNGGNGGALSTPGAAGSPNGGAGGAVETAGGSPVSAGAGTGGSGASLTTTPSIVHGGIGGSGGWSTNTFVGVNVGGGGGGAGWVGGGGGNGISAASGPQHGGLDGTNSGGGGGGSSLVPSTGVTVARKSVAGDSSGGYRGKVVLTLPTPGPLTFSPDPGTFGSSAVATVPVRQTITVTNTGTGPALPTAFTPTAGKGITVVTGAGAGTCQTATPPLSIPPIGGTCTVVLEWTPAAAGSLSSASLTVYYPDGTNPSDSVSLTGTAVAASVGPLAMSPSPVPFGTVAINGTSSQTVTVTNNGNTPITPTAITPAGTAVTVTGGTCSTSTAIAPSATCTVVLQWAPTTDSILSSASLTMTYTGGAGTNSVNLTGQTPAPQITGLSPNTGSTLGGTSITIQGTNFAPNATVTIGGQACTNPTVTSTSITCTTPTGTVGQPTIVVSNPSSGNVNANGIFTYVKPAITAISPAGGPVGGTNTVTLTGTNFGPGMIVKLGANTCTIIPTPTATSAQCTAPASTTGTGPVDVTVEDGTNPASTLPGGYTYIGQPTISNVAPPTGPTTGGTVVTVTGTNFVPGMEVTVDGNPCTPVTVVSPTELTCPTPPGVAGPVDVELTLPGTSFSPATLPNAFTYVTPSGGGGGGFVPATTPQGVPSAPLNVTVSPAPGQVTVAWNPPATGGPFTHYVVTLGPGGATCTVTTTSCVITGLAPGTYFATVVPFNANGAGARGIGSGVVPAGLDPLLPLQPNTGGTNANDPSGVLANNGAMKAGQSALLVDGLPKPVTIVPNKKQVKQATGLDVSADGWTMTLVGRGDTNDPAGLTDKAVLILFSEQLTGRTGSTVDAGVTGRTGALARSKVQPVAVSTGTGFMANSPVKFFILADTYMGTITVNADGTYKGQVPVPAGITPGTYTLQVNGFAPSGEVRSLSIGVIVKPAGNAPASVATATVYFDVLSAVITAKSQATLDKLVKKTGKNGVKTVAIGFVQPVGPTNNDQTLSTARAQAVASVIKAKGVRGAYKARGDGRAKETGADARRVEVTITYRK